MMKRLGFKKGWNLSYSRPYSCDFDLTMGESSMVSLWCSMQKLETSRNSINALRMEGPQIKAEYVPGKIRKDPCLSCFADSTSSNRL